MYYTLNGFMEQRVGFEPTVFQLCRLVHWASLPPLRCLERDKGIEPLTEDWKSAVIPFN